MERETFNFDTDPTTNPLEEVDRGIKNVSSFEELYEAIRAIGDVRGTHRNYSPEEMIKRIERVRHGHQNTQFITRSFGIREKVESLLPT